MTDVDTDLIKLVLILQKDLEKVMAVMETLGTVVGVQATQIAHLEQTLHSRFDDEDPYTRLDHIEDTLRGMAKSK